MTSKHKLKLNVRNKRKWLNLKLEKVPREETQNFFPQRQQASCELLDPLVVCARFYNTT